MIAREIQVVYAVGFWLVLLFALVLLALGYDDRQKMECKKSLAAYTRLSASDITVICSRGR